MPRDASDRFIYGTWRNLFQFAGEIDYNIVVVLKPAIRILHTEKSFRNLVDLNKIWIVFALFRQI